MSFTLLITGIPCAAKPVREDGMPDGYPLPIKAPQPKPQVEAKVKTL